MKKTLLFLSFLLSLSTYAQVTFMKGNFINSQNLKIECLIKNYDWNNFPAELEYKLNENNVVERIYAAQLNSFYIYETSHYYKKYDVPAIPVQPNGYSIKSGVQFLKVLVEGKVSLLLNNDNVYFLETDDKFVVPLIRYKYTNSDDRVEENNSFRLELLNRLKCENITAEDIRKVSYSEKSLTKIVNSYNKCNNSESENYTSNKTKAEFNIKLVAGVNFYTATADMNFTFYSQSGIVSTSDEINLKGKSESNFVAGFEAEVKLPFSHKKWALFIVPTYNKQKSVTYSQPLLYLFSTYPFQSGYRGDVILKDYSYIELPIGIRRYLYLNSNSQLNLNISYGVSLNTGSGGDPTVNWNDDSRRVSYVHETYGSSLLRIGAGYTFKERYNLGINYYAVKSLGVSKANGSFSVMLGYKLF